MSIRLFRRASVVALVLAAALVTGVTAPAGAQTATPPPPPSCTDAIDAKLGKDYSTGFLGRWRNRLAGADAGFSWNRYQGTPDGAPSIVDGVIPRPFFRQLAEQERFTQLVPETDRVCLVNGLFTRMQGQGLDPTLDPNLVKTLLYSLVFTEGFFDTQFGGNEQPAEALPTVPEPTALRDLLSSLRELLGNPNLSLVDALPTLPRVDLPDLQLPQLTLPHLTDILGGGLPQLPVQLPKLELKLPKLDLAVLQRLVSSTVGSATYLVCTNASVAAPRSADRCSLPSPLGTPITADVNGDVVPDLVVTLLPNVGAITGGNFGIDLTFKRTPLLNRRPLPGRAYVVVQPPASTTRLMIGTANRTTLADTTTARITFENPSELADGVVRGPVQLSYSGVAGAPDTTFLLGTSHYENDPSVELDPMSLQATLTPVPDRVDAVLRIDPRPTKDGTYAGRPRQLVELTNVTASPTKTGAARYDLGLAVHSENSFKKSPTKIFTMNGTVTDLPTTINRIALESFPASGDAALRPVTLVDYLATSTTPKVRAELETRLASAAEGTFDRADIEVRDLPAQIHADITGPPTGLPATTAGETVVNYVAPSRVPFARATVTESLAGEVKSSVDATLTDLPTSVTATMLMSKDTKQSDIKLVSAEQLGGAVVDATLRKLDAPRSATHVWASATAIPRVVDVKLRKPGERDVTAQYAGFSAPDAPAGSAGIGTLHAKVATAAANEAPEFLKPAAGQEADYSAQHAFVQTDANDVVRADLRLDGLSITDVILTDPTTAGGDERVDAKVRGAGSNRFVASVKTEDLDAVSTLTPLPPALDVVVAGDGANAPQCQLLTGEVAGDDITCIDYTTTGSAVRPTATTTVRTNEGLVATGTVNELPGHAVIRLNDTKSTLDYTADATVPKVTALVSTPVADFRSPGDAADPVLSVDATLTEVPQSFKLGFDPDAISFEARNGATVGSITAKAALGKDKPTLDGLTLPNGNHVVALVDDDASAMTGETAGAKHLHASLKLTSLARFSYAKTAGDGLAADFDGATGQPLDLDIDLHTGGASAADAKRLVLRGSVAAVPPALHLEKGDHSGELTLGLSAGASYPADAKVFVGTPSAVQLALPNAGALPRVEGISARDWPTAAGTAIGLGVRFHDAPQSVDVDMFDKKFVVAGYAPDEVAALDVDVILDDGDPSLHLQGGLSGFPSNTPSGVTIGPVVKREGTAVRGTPDLSLTVDADGFAPAVDLLVVLPGDAAGPPGKRQPKHLGLDIPALPLEPLTFSMENFVQSNAPAGVKPDVELRFKGVGSVPLGAAKVTYGPASHPESMVADLRQVPASFDLALEDVIPPPAPDPCKDDSRTALPTQFPEIRYTASANTLDADLGVAFGGLSGLDHGMVLGLQIEDLGGTGAGTNIAFEGEAKQLRASSAVATKRLYAEVEDLSVHKGVGDPGPCDVPEEHNKPLDLEFVLDVGFRIDVPKVTVEMKNLQTLTMNLGIASSILGDFSDFEVRVYHIHGEARAQVGVDVIFDFGEPFVGRIGLRVGPAIVGDFLPLFHVGENDHGVGFPIVESPIPCDLGLPPPTFGLGIKLKPGLQSTGLSSLEVGGFHVTDPGPAQGHAWTLTPNIPLGVINGGAAVTPQLPAWAIHIITLAAAPTGTQRGVTFGVTCQ
ncbi:MAG: hypothetical protein M3163_04475 [Actinomycetota bacterium]|nr:hypothetical protein [Actinomycetota bacterium]